MKLVLAGGVTVAMLAVSELVVRGVDGYRLLSPRLRPVSGYDPTGGVPAEDLVRAFLAQPILVRDDLAPAWFASSPPPLPTLEMPSAMAKAYAAGLHTVFLYQWNETLLRAVWVKGTGPSLGEGLDKPDAYWVFEPVDGQPWPRYRFPQAVSLPTGLTLNSLGFRGREIAVDKPPRTIRIACVGASTTVDEHYVPHSYPELLEHFLQQWCRERHPLIEIEVINAACEGYYSHETAASVRHYVLPLAVDYVVYYEGANQLHMPQVERHVRIAGERPPKPAFADIFDPTAAAKGERKWLYEHSAMLRRLHTVMARGEPVAEPAKPKQTVELPAGLDNGAVDLLRAGELIGLGGILGDLAAIRADVAAAGGRLVLCSFQWFVHDGLELDPIASEHVWRHLNDFYWPVSYASLRRLADLQNAWYAAWAAANDVDFLDVAAAMPEDARLYTDAVHKTSLGSRCHAWAACALLLPVLGRDLASGRLPVADPRRDGTHPHVAPMRQLTRAQLDAGK